MSSDLPKKRILHVIVGDEHWAPTQEQLDQVEAIFESARLDPLGAVIATRKGIKVVEIPDYDGVKISASDINIDSDSKKTFDSTDDKRVNNNPVIDLENYTGPDDVAFKYFALSNEDKTKMLDVKKAAQHFINTLRDLDQFKGSVDAHPDIEYAIKQAQTACMFGVRYLTQSSKK